MEQQTHLTCPFACAINGYGEVWNKFMYEPFGEPKAAGKLLLNRHKEELLHVPFGFTGEAHDFYSGLIYLRARYYDPATARMLTKDTHWNINNMIYGDKEYREGEIKVPDINAIKQSANLYVYAMNNPIMHIDPSGEAVYGAGISGEAGIGLFVRGSVYRVWDDHGNNAIIIMGDGGGGLGLGYGISGFEFPTMDNIRELKEKSVNVSIGAGVAGASYMSCGGHETVVFSGILKGKPALGYSGTTTLFTWFVWSW